MTEDAWEISTDLVSMLDFLCHRASERQLRLFCIACCRRIWDVMPPEGRSAIEVAERYVNGKATDSELHAANQLIGDFCEGEDDATALESRFASNAAFHSCCWRCEIEEAEDCGRNAELAGLSTEEMCQLLRKVVGNPFCGQAGLVAPDRPRD